MHNDKTPWFRQFFAFRFAILIIAAALFSVALTSWGLYHFYASSLDEEANLASSQFRREIDHVQREMEVNVQEMARLAAPVDSGTAFGALSGKSDLKVLGIGDKDWWNSHFSFPEMVVDTAFSCFGCGQLVKLRDGPLLFLVSASVSSSSGEPLRLLATRDLGQRWLEETSQRIGAELALCDEEGYISASSFDRSSDFTSSFLSLRDDELVNISGKPYGFRLYPLESGGIKLGYFVVFSQAAPLQSLAFRLGAFQIGGSLLALLAFYFLYVTTFRTTTRELGDLAKWAEDYSGFSEAPPPPSGRFQEVRVLSNAFKSLVGRLNTASEDMLRQNEKLEEQVRDKTLEIFANHSLLKDILSEMPQAVLLLEEDHTIAYANESAVSIFGAVPGMRLPGPLAIALAGHFSDDSRTEEVRFTLSGMDYSSVVRDVGSPARSLVLVRDETRKLAIERQLLQAQKLEAVSRLAGGVAHEFNNALASILPGVEMLRLRTEDPKSLGYLDVIENAAHRGADVVKQILFFSRSSEESRNRLRVNNVVEVAVKLLRPASKNVEISWIPGPDVPDILGDERQLQQMMLNLAINSLDALEGKGKITIETWAGEKSGEACLAITDNGPGIPAHLVQSIFDPFFTTKEPGMGTGLGLAIAFAVVEGHGGTIRHIRPTEGGARFEIRFPGIAEPPLSTGSRSGTRDEDIVIR
jgi:signal transduction histidine kinase